LKNGKNHQKRKNSKQSRDMPKLAIRHPIGRPENSNPLGSVVSTMFCKAKSAKKLKKLRGDFRPLPNKNVQMLDHSFPSLFPQGFRISKNI
jgi:hypothetical protein